MVPSDPTQLVDLAQRLLGRLRDMVRTIKTSPRELGLAVVALGAVLLAAGQIPLLDTITEPFDKLLTPVLGEEHWTQVKAGLQALLILLAGLLFIWTLRRLWQQATPNLPSDTEPVQAAAIKGPLAFTEQDGKLFRRLGQEVELTQLVGLLDDDQTGLAVVMGESGAGKTSLLRAVQSRWQAARYPAPPQSLDDLPIPPLGTGRRVVVLDQFEQLHPEQDAHRPIFELLRHIAGELSPHRTTWLVAFRREYAATWLEFLEPRIIQPPILFVNRFQPAQAGVVIATLAEEADIQLKQDLADAMVRDMATAGRVSPVDIGIGMMMLDELARG